MNEYLKSEKLSDIYDCPINLHLEKMQIQFQEEFDNHIINEVHKVGVDIDKEGLMQAIRNDRVRYETAFLDGWKSRGEIDGENEEDAQKSYEPREQKDAQSGWTRRYCGKCGKQFWRSAANFCEMCGAKVKK